MIKAEVINKQSLGGKLCMDQVQFDAKGTHHDLVVELKTIINTFNEEEAYQLELMNIIKEVLEGNLDCGLKELEKLKKENK